MHLQVTQLHAPARLRAQPQGSPSAEATRFEWLEVVKGVALLWIVWNHLAERLFGFPLAGNPNADWPPLAERLAQLRPLTGHGWLDLPLNLMRWVGWSGDQGVQLFLIAGGFGLTWGLLVRGRGPRLAAAEFWRRRARRIYPLWWAAHLFFVVPCLLLGRGLDPRQLTFWLDLLGVRVTPYALYYFAPAWWYVGLLVQLTAVYPLLWTALRRLGPARFLVAALAISFAVRGAGLLFFHTYLDAWSRGAIFVTRLPEFATGMAVAAWMTAATRLAALAAWLVGSVLSLGLLGMTVAPFLLGVGAFGLLYAPASAADRAGRRSRGWGWLGRHSYSLFLMHQPFLAVCVPRGPVGAPERVALGVAAALTMTVVSALALESRAR
jgi:peptidoglycan/LPS O-acetylase OafA/YrhL